MRFVFETSTLPLLHAHLRDTLLHSDNLFGTLTISTRETSSLLCASGQVVSATRLCRHETEKREGGGKGNWGAVGEEE